jgi:hypothetical protein
MPIFNIADQEEFEFLMLELDLEPTEFRIKEPECLCKHLLDGHDPNCQYVKYKNKSK